MEAEDLVDAEGFSDDVLDPTQHLAEAKTFQSHLRFGAVLAFGEVAKMKPDPHIAQDQSDANKQQPLDGIASAGFDLRFVHLPKAGFDAKSRAIDFPNFPRRAANFPDNEHLFVSASLARFLSFRNTSAVWSGFLREWW